MRRAILISLAFISSGCPAHAQARGEVAPTWTLIEDLRFSDDQGPTSFADVRGVAVTKNGNIFVLDTKPQSIRMFDAQGTFIKQVARDGAGPGEIRRANGIAVGADDIVWAYDPSNKRINLYRSDGSFFRQILVPINQYGYLWNTAVDAQGRAIDEISVISGRDPATGMAIGESRLRRIDQSGRVDTLARPSCKSDYKMPAQSFLQFSGGRGQMNMLIPFLPVTHMLYTRSGHAWCVATSQYRLFVGPVDGSNRVVVDLKVAPPVVTEAERKDALNRIDSLTRAYGKMTVGDPSQIPKMKPVIANIHVDPSNRIWVRPTTAAEATPSFDVYDLDGRHVARVQSRGKVNGWQAWITDTHVYTVVHDDDDVPNLVRYRIQR